MLVKKMFNLEPLEMAQIAMERMSILSKFEWKERDNPNALDMKKVYLNSPNPNEWESLLFLTSISTLAVWKQRHEERDDIKKVDGVKYIKWEAAPTNNIPVYTPDTFWISYHHFQEKVLLRRLIEELLVDTGIQNLKSIGNDLEYEGAKIAGISCHARNGFISESMMLCMNYDNELFRAILPDEYYFRANGKGITGIENIKQPNFNRIEFLNDLETTIKKIDLPYIESSKELYAIQEDYQGDIPIKEK